MDMRRIAPLILVAVTAPASAYFVSGSLPAGYNAATQTLVRGSQATYIGGTILGNTFMTAGGASRAIPVRMALGPTASLAASVFIRANPLAATAGMAALYLGALVYDYYTNKWMMESVGSSYTCTNGAGTVVPCTEAGAKSGFMASYPSTFYATLISFVPNGSSGAGAYNFNVYTSEGALWADRSAVLTPHASPTTTMVPATEEDWAQVATRSVPDVVANELPATFPMPVTAPEVSEPTRIIIGSPYLDPTTGTWKEPALDVRDCQGTHSGEVCIHAEPRDVAGDDPATPVDETDQTVDETTKPDGAESVGLCDLYPTILACDKLGDPEAAPELEVEERGSYSAATGFGADTAACPAPHAINIAQGADMQFSYSGVCQYVSALRPLVLALAALTAAYILLGVRTDE